MNEKKNEIIINTDCCPLVLHRGQQHVLFILSSSFLVAAFPSNSVTSVSFGQHAALRRGNFLFLVVVFFIVALSGDDNIRFPRHRPTSTVETKLDPVAVLALVRSVVVVVVVVVVLLIVHVCV